MMEENMEEINFIINKWDPNSSIFAKATSLFQESRFEATKFLNSVKQLQQAMHFYSTNHYSHQLVHAQTLMQVAMNRLEKEFYQILSSNRHHLALEDEKSGPNDYIFSNLAMSDLSSIADCMISSGYTKECVKIYKIIRKSIVDEALYKLGFEKLTPSDTQKLDWETLETKIKNWVNAVKIAVKSVFHGERIVCDNVFSSSDSIRQSCFSDITKEAAFHLFQFPEFVARFQKSPERIFRMLDLYDAIYELLSEIDAIFSYDSTSVVRSQVHNSLSKLADTVRLLLSEFESAIQKDSSKTQIAGGGLHPLTRYVMNYLSFLTDYTGILSDIFANFPLTESLPESYFQSPKENPSSILATRMAWIILLLLCKLDIKAKLYNDSAMAYLFLTNNLHYVMKKVKNSGLCLLLGEEWVLKQQGTMKQYEASYERLGWSKVLSALPDVTVVATAMTLEEAKRFFKDFNLVFEQTCRDQSSWVVTDGELKEEIQASIAKKLIPAYKDFYDRFEPSVRFKKDMVRSGFVKFAPEDLANYLSDLFHGTGTPKNASSSLHQHKGE